MFCSAHPAHPTASTRPCCPPHPGCHSRWRPRRHGVIILLLGSILGACHPDAAPAPHPIPPVPVGTFPPPPTRSPPTPVPTRSPLRHPPPRQPATPALPPTRVPPTPPVLQTNRGLTLPALTCARLTSAMITAEDPDTPPASVTYRLTRVPRHGVLRLRHTPLERGSTFSQAALETGQLTYTHHRRGTTTDSFAFGISDGSTPVLTRLAAIPHAQIDWGLGRGLAFAADGHTLAFIAPTSPAAGDPHDPRPRVFVYDRLTGRTTRVPGTADGVPLNWGEGGPALSANGQVVAFHSVPQDRAHPPDRPVAGDPQVFVHDRSTGRTTRISVSADGTPTDGGTSWPALSADGQVVAFTSDATNLVPGDTNGAPDVFVHDRLTGRTTRIARTDDPTSPRQYLGGIPALSADGQVVAFTSDATNLVPGDTTPLRAVFVHDRQTGQTTRVTRTPDGTPPDAGAWGPTLSADGRLVAFTAYATNLVLDDTNAAADGFVYDRQTGQTTRIAVTADGSPTNGGAWAPTLAADGRLVAVLSGASNLDPTDRNTRAEVFIADLARMGTFPIHITPSAAPANGPPAATPPPNATACPAPP